MVNGRREEDERERRMVARARYNKYNGWASSWRESPGDFAGFCNWNAFRGRAKQGTRWINAALLLLCRGCLYFATRLAAERQLNEMSDAILVPSLPSPSFPFAVTLRYMRLLSVSPESSTLSLFLLRFFLYLFHLHHSCCRYHPYHLRSFFLRECWHRNSRSWSQTKFLPKFVGRNEKSSSRLTFGSWVG